MGKTREYRRSDERGPVIGYLLSLQNKKLKLDFCDSPHEVLEDLRARGLEFREIADHPRTGLQAAQVYKEAPDLEFSGGPLAETIFNLLVAIEEDNLRQAEGILERSRVQLSQSQDQAIAVPLLAAVAAGNLDAVRLITAKGIGVDRVSSLGMTALHWAGALGEPEIVEVLLASGADCNRLSWFYVTPQELAAWNLNVETRAVFAKRVGHQASEPTVEQVLARMGWGN